MQNFHPAYFSSSTFFNKILSNNGYQVNFKLDLEKNIPFLELIDTKSVESPEEIATLLVNAGYPPKFLAVEKEDLEDYFFRILSNYKIEV